MRITGGAIRGRRLISMKGLNIRPTSDMVRSAIFNILGQTLNGFTTLDLFAGTGSLGIESLSRGSEKAVFVDNSRKALAILKKNLSVCEYESCAIVTRGELPKGLAHIKDFEDSRFDLIFIDPPYGKGYISPTLYKLVDEDLCANNSRVVVESSASADDPLPTNVHDLTLKLTRMYGSTLIGLYTYHEGR
jgi:16S rRNA (guanine966-N2)-methyltransferase